DNEKFPYLLYDVKVVYDADSGLRQMPVGDDTSPPSIVRSHAPVATKTLTFHVIRQGSKPDLPSPISPSPNEVLAHVQVIPLTPYLDEAGKVWVHEVSGRYEYFVKQSADVVSNYHVPSVPYATNSNNENDIPAASFRKDLS